jgi:hypothetical protein
MDYIIDNIFFFIVLFFGLALLIQGGRYFYESLFWPIYSQNKRIKEIPGLLANITGAFVRNDAECRAKLGLLSTQAKSLATDVMGVKNFILLYDFWASLGIVQERERVNKIGRDLIFLANAANKKSFAPYVIQQIKEKIYNVENLLELDKEQRNITEEDLKKKEPDEEPKQEELQEEKSQEKPADKKSTVKSPK